MVLYGNSAKPPTDPLREGYDFTGWSADFDNITGNLEVVATLVKSKAPKNHFSRLVKNTQKCTKISYAVMAQSVEHRLGKELRTEKTHNQI